MSTTGLRPWSDYVDLIRQQEELIGLTWKPEDKQYRADFYRQLLMNLSYAYVQYFQSNPDHPEFMPLWNSVYLFQPNPDDVYYYAPLDGRKRYRIVGDRGSIHMVMFQFGKGMMGMVEPGGGQQHSSYLDEKDLVVGADGRFEILLSPERPDGFTGTWHPIREDVDCLMVRLRSYDWGNEADVRMAIECLDAPLQKRRMDIAEIDEKLRGALTLSNRLNPLFYGFQNRTLERVGKNAFELEAFADTGLATQLYWACVFEVAEDEALIVETELPEVRPYWNIQVNDPYFNAVEFVHRQTSINGHTAKIDSDGKFRAVLSHKDPGIANWLDSGGFTEGTLFGRWTQCDTHPMPAAKLVKLAELDRHLPADSARVTPNERTEALRQRRLGAQLRRRW
ncbi:MAG: DUF1214 domain-containing protein [Novosphingobium sp.]|nr:DUF1214 domain-containing protein [Novosphingobium sp.]MCP5404428.1 DUF1214 domain-containing protein [Novosphingobium sp.]